MREFARDVDLQLVALSILLISRAERALRTAPPTFRIIDDSPGVLRARESPTQ